MITPIELGVFYADCLASTVMHTTIIYGEAGMTPSKEEIVQLVYEIRRSFAQQAGDKENALFASGRSWPPHHRSRRGLSDDLFDAHRLLIRQRRRKVFAPIPQALDAQVCRPGKGNGYYAR